MAWRLAKVDIEGVRRAAGVRFDTALMPPDTAVVVLNGPAGAGKSSALLGIGWGLAGEVRTPELGKLNKDEIRSPMFNAVAYLEFFDTLDPCGNEQVELLRTLTPSGTHDLRVAGRRFRTIGDATTELERIFGCTVEQMGYLTSTDQLVGMSGLEQAKLLCGLMGPEIDVGGLARRIGEVGANADGLYDAPPTELTGWPLLEAALTNAEAARTKASGTVKTAQAAVASAQGAMMESLKTARVPGPGNVEASKLQASEVYTRALSHVGDLLAQERKASGYAASLQAAQERLSRAEARVATVKKQRNEAEAVREERDAQRALLTEELAEAQRRYEEANGALEVATADEKATIAALRALEETIGKATGADCPTCGQKITADRRKQIDEALAAARGADDAAQKVSYDLLEKRAEARHLVDEKRALLQNAPPLPTSEALDAEFRAAVDESDAALKALEDLRAETVAAAPTPQAIEAARRNEAEAAARVRALEDAGRAVEVYEGQQQNGVLAVANHAALNKLVDRLREVIREVADVAIKPVLDRSNDMLDGRLVLGYSAEAGVEAVYPWNLHDGATDVERRPIKELSKGERLMVGVTLQASIALELGIGMVLVDDASVWDPATFKRMLEAMVITSHECENALLWVVASAQPVPETAAGGVAVVNVDGGYSFEA